MPGNVVCNGAMCSCTQGAAPTPLTVTSQQILTIQNIPVATIQDAAPVGNIKPFGNCKVLTTAASGTPTPCAPALAPAWTPGSTVQSVNNVPVLTKDSTLVCTVGGVISITNPNCAADAQVL